MRKNILWLVVSSLMVAVLILAACAPAPTEKAVTPAAKGPEMEKLTLKKADGTVVEKTVEKPRYGGELTMGVEGYAVYTFDMDTYWPYPNPVFGLVYDDLLDGNWAMGRAGTGETNWAGSPTSPLLEIGRVAERWELIEPDTLVFHLRRGIRYHLNPDSPASALVNAREVTADDVVYNLKWVLFSDTTIAARTAGGKPKSITALDKYTVEVKADPGLLGPIWLRAAEYVPIMPPEIKEKLDHTNWRNHIGTGPFLLKDFAERSSWTFVRNPNYWVKDPLRPNNTLPYVDGVKFLVILDVATRLSALRTGKIDRLSDLSYNWETAKELARTNPEIKQGTSDVTSAWHLFPNLGRPELPASDIRVRKALSMAINRQEIVDTFYGGKGVIFAWPIGPALKDIYIPLEKQPEEIREVFEYNPEKAKKLLAEAGYPNGFKIKAMVWNTYTDIASIVKEYWAKIGVVMELDLKDYASWIGETAAMKYEMSHDVLTAYGAFDNPVAAASDQNPQNVSDPYVEDYYKKKIGLLYFKETERRQALKEIAPYLLKQVWFIQLPSTSTFVFWQPWLKGYYGEASSSPGYLGFYRFVMHVWLDSDLKAQMIGK